MALGTEIGDILRQYASGQPGADVESDFDQVARNADGEQLQHGVTEAFRSSETPPFGDMVGQLFGHADAQQRAGIMGHLLNGAGPGLISSLLGAGGGRGLGGFLGDGAGMGAMGALLGKLAGGQAAQASQIDPADIDNLSPEQVQELATHAERENPGVMEHVSRYVAQHPDMLKALGGATLAFMLGKLAQRRE
jgi:hypothetical protein